jgi:KaiC/GvpD/RAD55 family RecA-like ATPase
MVLNKKKSLPTAKSNRTTKKNPLTINGKNITALLEEKYKALKKTGWITLLNAPVERNMEVNIEAIRVLIEDMGFEGIYISVNKSYPELTENFTKAGLDVSRLRFIDAVSQMYGAMPVDNKQCRYVQGPLNITSIVNSVKDFLKEMTAQKSKIFVFIDSITTMLLYNHLPRTVRFSKFLTEDLRKTKVNGIMVSVAAGMTSERLIEEVKEFCDEVIDIGGGND